MTLIYLDVNNKKKYNLTMEMEMSYDYNEMGIQKNSSEETTFSSEENYIPQPARTLRCIHLRENYMQIFKYLIWILISCWYLLSLVSLFKTSYVQERQMCPYSDFWT